MYNHVFHVGTSELYATPYSITDDIFDRAVPVCSSFYPRISDDNLARLLTEILFYHSQLEREPLIATFPHWYRIHLLRHLYSLSVRLVRVTGIYAANSILETLRVSLPFHL